MRVSLTQKSPVLVHESVEIAVSKSHLHRTGKGKVSLILPFSNEKRFTYSLPPTPHLPFRLLVSLRYKVSAVH